MAAFPWNVRWKGVDYERAGLVISRPPEYAEEDSTARREALSLATAEKGRVMADAAIQWVVATLEQMIRAGLSGKREG